jgi:transposase
VYRFNEQGPDGLVDQWSAGSSSRLSSEQRSELAAIVEKSPHRAADGVVRWRRVDLKRVIKERFGVDYDTRYVGKLLYRLGFSRVSAPAASCTRRPYCRGVQKNSRAP